MDSVDEKRFDKLSGTVVLAGGGTGGHLFPGISVAQEFQRRYPDIKIVFFGTATGLDAQVVKEYGYPLQVIGLKRRKTGLTGLIKLACNGLSSLQKCRSELKKLRPLAVIGLGGFAAATPALAAHWLGIPVFLLEQNAIPGRTNRYLSSRAKCIYSQYENIRLFHFLR